MSIVVVSSWGLGNRLRSIASSKILSDELKLPLDHIWTHVHMGDTTWNDLFQNSTYFRKIDHDKNADYETQLLYPNSIELEQIKPWHLQPSAPTVDSIVVLPPKADKILVCTYMSFRLPSMSEEEYLQKKFHFYKNDLVPNRTVIEHVIQRMRCVFDCEDSLQSFHVYLPGKDSCTLKKTHLKTHLHHHHHHHHQSVDETSKSHETEHDRSRIDVDSMVNSISSNYRPHIVGVHIRGTDRAKHLKNYPHIDLWVEKMKRCIDENTSTLFYIATDEPEKKKYLESYHYIHGDNNRRISFKDRIINQDHILDKLSSNYHRDDRFTISGQIGALVDLYCLAQCHHIIGSGRSTFSFEAYHLALALQSPRKISICLIDDLSNPTQQSVEHKEV
eukprot:TRINITY_DN1856_c0_g1_i1.p1 TRINITY_DN1856_c0_g1~~TRINITY_DN1856_c0_g1_i1.p1  ORF type:complete len:389 (+),score=51.93 TRINITY_DN1856_c0_g1_i1:50-1216(+)